MFKLIIFILLLIVAIVGIIFSIIGLIKCKDKDYLGANILSYFIPLIGLIIYAVNIGKNDKLAKSCVKTALFGLLATICILLSCFFTIGILHGLYDEKVETVEGNRIKENSDKAKDQYEEINGNKNDNESYDDINSALKSYENDKIKSADGRLTGKIWYIEITFVNGTTEEDAKNITWDFFKKYSFDRQYDYNVTIKVNGNEYIGYFDGIQGNNVIWAN